MQLVQYRKTTYLRTFSHVRPRAKPRADLVQLVQKGQKSPKNEKVIVENATKFNIKNQKSRANLVQNLVQKAIFLLNFSSFLTMNFQNLGRKLRKNITSEGSHSPPIIADENSLKQTLT